MAPRPDVAEERRAQIMEAALTRFARQGYANTTMDDIAEESDLSKGAIYWYFKSKDELFKAVANAVMESAAAESLQAVVACETSAERLRVGARCLVEVCREIEGYFGLIIEFWSQSESREEIAAFWGEMTEGYRQVIVAIFEEGIRRGQFKPVDADALAWMMMAAYDGLAVYNMLMPELYLVEISAAFIEALLKGLVKDDASE